MKVAQLRKVLAIAEEHHRLYGRAEIADGLASLGSNLLDVCDEMTVASLVKRIKDARRPKASSKSANRRQQGRPRTKR